MARKTLTAEGFDLLAGEVVTQREKHGGDAAGRHHAPVVDVGAIITRLRGPSS